MLTLVLGVVVIGVGVWLITTDRVVPPAGVGIGSNAMMLGVSLALVAAVGWAASTVLVRPALTEVDPLVASTIRLPFATLVLVASTIRLPFATHVLVVAALRLRRIDSRGLVLKPTTTAWLIFAGLLTVALAALFLWSVDLVGVARTAALSSVSPIFSATIAVLLLGEQLTPRLALGMGVSLAGVLAIVVVG